AEQLNLGDNGLTDRSYNIHRWYRPTWGRYSQDDPLSISPVRGSVATTALHYTYAVGSPLAYVDRLGLYTVLGDPGVAAEIDQAVQLLEQTLGKGPCCAGGFGDKILSRLHDPGLIIEWNEDLAAHGDCGFTPLKGAVGFDKRIQLSSLSRDCCGHGSPGAYSMASIILHELRHLPFGTETAAYNLGGDCFGCQVPAKFRIKGKKYD